MNPWFVGIIFLILFAIVLVAISLGHRFVETQSKKRVGAILQAASGERQDQAETSILIDSSKEDPLKALLAQSELPERISGVIQQAGLSWTVTHLVMLMLSSSSRVRSASHQTTLLTLGGAVALMT